MEINGNALGHTLISGLVFLTFWFIDFGINNVSEAILMLSIIFIIGYWFIHSTSRLFEKSTKEVRKR